VSTVRPPIPDTDWRVRSFPNLESARIIGLDLETKDPNLREMGPGVRRRDTEGGFIAGIAVSVGPRDGEQWYFPMRHESGKKNLDPDIVMRWAKDQLERPNQPKIGANLGYDVDWLHGEGVEVSGPFYDVQIADPLIDENAFKYSLEALAERYDIEGKADEQMYEWLAMTFGGEPTRADQAKNIWRAPAELVGPYAESDVRIPFEIWEKQMAKVKEERLEDVLDIETRLIPMMMAMRWRGVRVDVDRAASLDEELSQKAVEYRQRLSDIGIDAGSTDSLVAYCRAKGITHKKTAVGNPSFPGKWLEENHDENLNLVYQVRRLEKHAGTFVKGTIFNNVIGDRIHGQFHQLRNDDYGAVSGRFSSSNPNLQNIPIRDEELGPLIRGLFIADPEEVWYSDDWSQIEYRLLCHYAVGDGAERTRQRYRDDPSTDFHEYVAQIADIDRKRAKNINFGLVYGMGEKTMAASMGRTIAEIKPVFQQYHRELPFVKKTYDEVLKRAEMRGFIHTLLGRRRRFNLYESRDWNVAQKARKDGVGAKPYDQAVEKWGANVKRAGGHKALNALLQGGAADCMKIAMVKIWESGICDVLGAPLLTVHDELNWSAPKTKEAEEAHEEALKIMSSCVELRVPLLVDTGKGRNWSEAK